MDRKQCVGETFKHIDQVRVFLAEMASELGQRSVLHDASKIRQPELDIFVEYTPKLAGSTYGSDEYHKYLKGMKVALDHHYAKNRHHPEHFSNGIKGMTLLDLVEMLCDWKAATLRHNDGDIIRSIHQNQKRFGFTDELKEFLLNTVKYLEWEPKPYCTCAEEGRKPTGLVKTCLTCEKPFWSPLGG
jgi:hypothetical protein